MSRFDRYVLSQLLVVFGFFSLVLVGIYWINQVVTIFDRLISDGQTAGVVLAFSALSLPSLILNVLPTSAFAAAVFVTNRLNSESELVVMQATGFSPFRLAVPYLNFGILVALMLSVLTHFLAPAASRETERQKANLADNIAASLLTTGEFLHPTKGVTFYVGEVTSEGVLRSVFLSDARNASRQTTYLAREAFLLAQENGPTIVMVDGMAQTLNAAGQRLAVMRFDDFAYDIGQMISSARSSHPSAGQLPTLDLLRADPEQIKNLNSTRARFQWEGHERFSVPLSAIVTTLVGFGALLLGAFSRCGLVKVAVYYADQSI